MKYEKFECIGDVLDRLIEMSEICHDEYESVKLYGNSYLMLVALHQIITDEKYSDVTIASLDFTMGFIDPVLKDDYVLIITDEKELYIQSMWNGDTLFANEAKYTIYEQHIEKSIIDSLVIDDSISVIGKLNFITQK